MLIMLIIKTERLQTSENRVSGAENLFDTLRAAANFGLQPLCLV